MWQTQAEQMLSGKWRQKALRVGLPQAFNLKKKSACEVQYDETCLYGRRITEM